MGREKRLHSRTALLSEFLDGGRRDREHQRCAHARNFWRLGHDRSHFTGGRNQSDFTGRRIFEIARNSAGGFQQLRQPSWKRFGHDARNVRERAHQKSDGAGNRGRCDEALSGW